MFWFFLENPVFMSRLVFSHTTPAFPNGWKNTQLKVPSPPSPPEEWKKGAGLEEEAGPSLIYRLVPPPVHPLTYQVRPFTALLLHTDTWKEEEDEDDDNNKKVTLFFACRSDKYADLFFSLCGWRKRQQKDGGRRGDEGRQHAWICEENKRRCFALVRLLYFFLGGGGGPQC